MDKTKIGIIGAAGYTGGELIRLLLHHPEVDLVFAQSQSNAGKNVSRVHADLSGETDLIFSADYHFDIDVLFFCSGHGEAIKFLQSNTIPGKVRLIDLGNDFRLEADAVQGNRTFQYGLPENSRASITQSNNIANPGCFATAIQLGLLPMASEGLLQQVHTTGITGSTGAGQSLSPTSHFSWRANNIQAYKTLTHQHNAEIAENINRTLPQKQESSNFQLHFVPWRGDFTRGIFISSMIHTDLSLEAAKDLYHTYYKSAVFTHVQGEPLFLKQVVNTNKCLIQLEKQGDMLVVHSAIDNLLKGAAGQAVQNMNLMLGFPENTGLRLKASYF